MRGISDTDTAANQPVRERTQRIGRAGASLLSGFSMRACCTFDCQQNQNSAVFERLIFTQHPFGVRIPVDVYHRTGLCAVVYLVAVAVAKMPASQPRAVQPV